MTPKRQGKYNVLATGVLARGVFFWSVVRKKSLYIEHYCGIFEDPCADISFSGAWIQSDAQIRYQFTGPCFCGFSSVECRKHHQENSRMVACT